MKRTYDTILIPTGEPLEGKDAFPVSKKAIELYNTGKFGSIFITGGYNGFAETNLIESEAEITNRFLLEKGVPESNIYYDSQSLDTVGNFTFPELCPMNNNPKLSDFEKVLIIGQSGHMWRIKDYAKIAMKNYDKADFHEVSGKHNDGLVAKFYHKGLMKQLNKDPTTEGTHKFLLENHPFYSDNWYEFTSGERKIFTIIKGLSWYF